MNLVLSARDGADVMDMLHRRVVPALRVASLIAAGVANTDQLAVVIELTCLLQVNPHKVPFRTGELIQEGVSAAVGSRNADRDRECSIKEACAVGRAQRE